MSDINPQNQVQTITLRDPEVIRLIEAERAKTGDKTAAKTAGRIIERFFAMRSVHISGTVSGPIAD